MWSRTCLTNAYGGDHGCVSQAFKPSPACLCIGYEATKLERSSHLHCPSFRTYPPDACASGFFLGRSRHVRKPLRRRDL